MYSRFVIEFNRLQFGGSGGQISSLAYLLRMRAAAALQNVVQASCIIDYFSFPFWLTGGALTTTVAAALPTVSKGHKVLRKHFVYLTDSMDPDSGLLGHLFSSEVINFRESELIRAQQTFHLKNECLLRMLLKGDISEEDFLKFIDALDKSHQRHISEKLLKDYS